MKLESCRRNLRKLKNRLPKLQTKLQPSRSPKLQDNLDLLFEKELKAQLAIERTVEGSPEEEAAYSRLRKVDASIAKVEEAIARSCPRIWKKADPGMTIGDCVKTPFHPIWVVADKGELADGRTRILVRPSTGSSRSEEWYLDAPPAANWSLDEIESAIAQLKADIGLGRLLDRPVRETSHIDRETIRFQTPFKGEILGRKGKIYLFFVEGDCIYIEFRSGANSFCASERTRKNYHHTVIRQAIEAGKIFNSSSAIGKPCHFGRIHQSCDGWWWVWGDGFVTSHKFLTRLMALKYLEMNAESGDRLFTQAGN